MRAIIFAAIAILFGLAAHADGVPLRNGRYIGAVLVVKLTPEQKKGIAHFRTCHLENFKEMNIYTPYVFRLSTQQSRVLSAKRGFAPHAFDVYETYRGFNDAGPHWNLALRFSEDEIEIPLDLLLPDEKAKKAHETQGWNTSNPCFPALHRE